MKWNREDYLDMMTFQRQGRPMFSELFGPLIGLDGEWRSQGASEDEIEMIAFDWDFVPFIDCGGTCGPFGGDAPTVIEENEEYRLERDFLGRTCKLCKDTATISLPMDYPVKNRDDWLRVKEFYVYKPERVDRQAIVHAKDAQSLGAVVRAEIPGGWDTVRELMGEVEACLAYYTNPALMQDIMKTILDTSVQVLEEVTQSIKIDQLYVHEDMAGKSGPLVGPSQVEEFIAPHYRACWEVASHGGARLFNQDSDGNMTLLLDTFLDCGVNVMHPFEPAAGMDSVAVREKYGTRLAMLGGIDKHVLRQSKADIDRELEYKLQPKMRDSGGIVFSLDHRIPNGTQLENYRYYVEKGRELLGLPPLDGQKGWGRMAF